MGTPLGPKYIPYTYMDPLGWCRGVRRLRVYGLGFRMKELPGRLCKYCTARS